MAESLKLHLGCGKRHFPGFVHIDFVEYPHVDYVQDIRSLSQFADRSVEQIYAAQVLQYFDRDEIPPILQEWRRVLMPGGLLRLSVINFEMIARIYSAGFALEWFLGSLYGKISDGKGGHNYHRTTFDEASMRKIFVANGFDRIERWDWRQTEHAEYDDQAQAYFPHMEKERGLLMNLNIQARRIASDSD